MIEDGMQVRNRNFDQSTELVSLEALFLILGDCCYSEHGLPAPRIPDPTERGGEATVVCLDGVL